MATSVDAFTPEEKKQIQEATTDVIYGCIASEHSGALGPVKELIGGARGLAGAVKESQSELLDKLFTVNEGEQDDTSNHMDDNMFADENRQNLMDKGVASATSAMALLRSKAEPGEAEAFGRVLVATAEHAVSATKQGGFMMFGGEKVSSNEAAYVRRITEAVSS